MIHFVGAGPGAPDLITMRGARLLGEADVVVYAGSLVNPELLALAPGTCEVYDSARMSLEEVIDVMATATSTGRDVVRLHTGDPCLYGAIREQMNRLDELGIPYDDTPGVSSFCGAAASLNAEYTLPGVSQSLIVTRLAGRTPVPESEQLSALAAHGASMAIFLSAGMLERVQEALLGGGYSPTTPTTLVYKATWPDENVVRTCVGDLARDGGRAGIRKTALILVGEFLRGAGERSRLYDPTFSTGFRAARDSARDGSLEGTSRTRGVASHKHASASARTAQTLAAQTRTAQTLADGKPIRIVSFTDAGQALAERLASALGATAWRCVPGGLDGWAREGFAQAEDLVFVGATGIAVRAVAPYVRAKASDPAVVVVDERGRYAIPILSGHLGGANALARRIARICGAQAVITTATDGRNVFAVDEWARAQGCAVANPERIKHVSAALLAGDVVRVWSDSPLSGPVPDGIALATSPDTCDVLLSARASSDEHALRVVPRVLVLGVGCRKGVSSDALHVRLHDILQRTGFDQHALCCVCSIEAKKDEPGILGLCKHLGIPFRTFSATELAAVAGEFSASDFVRRTVGVDNVCERSAVLGADGGKLAWPKDAADGITMALAQRPFCPNWQWNMEVEA